MKLEQILDGVEYEIIQGNVNAEISSITTDSRKVLRGSLFVCIYGFTVDGHKFIENAKAKGAVALICEKDVELPKDITAVKVESSRYALCYMAKNFYENPSKNFNLIGITGTNGKTSSAFFIETIIETAKKKAGLIGTVELKVGGEKIDYNFATSTTPDTLDLYEIFKIMENKKADDVIMEVSSHSLALNKVEGCEFDIGIFTNLTQDHLDLHKTLSNYCEAKAKLFKMCKIGIINKDDKYADKIMKGATCRLVTFGINSECDYKAVNINYSANGVKFQVENKGKKYDFEIKIPGRFTVYNALGAIATAFEMGISPEIIIDGIKNIKGVRGRIQNIENDKGFNVIVDYAHTPDGIENIINAVREFTKNRVIIVFGCGGDRDNKKRPIMGEIAAKYSDYVIITSDNPRSEEPIKIIEQIEAGVSPITNNYEKIIDRREAIYKAVKMSQKGDSVIIAGKGHEDYEIFKDKTIHFDDVEEAENALKEY